MLVKSRSRFDTTVCARRIALWRCAFSGVAKASRAAWVAISPKMLRTLSTRAGPKSRGCVVDPGLFFQTLFVSTLCRVVSLPYEMPPGSLAWLWRQSF
jgi:hypothetical protein